jgi:hypothetical protein
MEISQIKNQLSIKNWLVGLGHKYKSRENVVDPFPVVRYQKMTKYGESIG